MPKRRGAPLKPAPIRFWKKVRRGEGCWEWGGCGDSDGYGSFYPVGRAGPPMRAHRFSYLLCVGLIPRGMSVLHQCDNRRCVRPEHLFLGTPTDNMIDRDRKGRQCRGERHADAKLTEDAVRRIRALYRSGGWTHRRLAARFGVSRSTVGYALTGKSWGHVR